jgi:hypothetical protein
VAFAYDVDPEERLISVISAVEPEPKDLAPLIRKILAHPDYRPGFDMLLDHRLRPRAHVERQIRDTLLRLRSHADQLLGSKIAIVVAPAALRQARKAEVTTALEELPFRLRVFTTLAEARRWLWSTQT